jgi:hypothetical protein
MKSKQSTAPRDPPSHRTCADCRWARWPYVWYAQTGECQIKRRTYITRGMKICTMFRSNEGSSRR